MVDPWMKTVKKTMARAVVRKSSLDNNDIMSENTFAKKYLKCSTLYHILSSRTAAREKPTAPLWRKLNLFFAFTWDFLTWDPRRRSLSLPASWPHRCGTCSWSQRGRSWRGTWGQNGSLSSCVGMFFHLTIVQIIIVAMTKDQLTVCSWVKMLIPRKRKMMQSLRNFRWYFDIQYYRILLLPWFRNSLSGVVDGDVAVWTDVGHGVPYIHYNLPFT